VKVIVFSGYGLDSEIQAMLARGASGFIRKPFTIRMLDHKIDEVLTT